MSNTIPAALRAQIRDKLVAISDGDYVTFRNQDGQIVQSLPMSVPYEDLPQFVHLLDDKTVRRPE